MQIKCTHCGIPFSLSKEVVISALETIQTENLKHFDARCPQCRKVNQISQERLLKAAPDWRKEETSEVK